MSGHETPKSRQSSSRLCARKGCRNRVTQAFDVWSWFAPQEQQTPLHYEVCDSHAGVFTEPFDSASSRRVKAEYVEHDAIVAPHVG
jgi:hypothetical protein